jgi:hypothetical protein
MGEYEVRIKVERTLLFRVDADSAAKAAHEASASLWDAVTPDEDEVTGTEVVRVKRGDREIELMWLLDWTAPKDERGLTPWKVAALVDGRKVAEGGDLAKVLEATEPAPVTAVGGYPYDSMGGAM